MHTTQTINSQHEIKHQQVTFHIYTKPIQLRVHEFILFIVEKEEKTDNGDRKNKQIKINGIF